MYAGAHLQKTEFMRIERNQEARHAGSRSLNSKSRIDMAKYPMAAFQLCTAATLGSSGSRKKNRSETFSGFWKHDWEGERNSRIRIPLSWQMYGRAKSCIPRAGNLFLKPRELKWCHQYYRSPGRKICSHLRILWSQGCTKPNRSHSKAWQSWGRIGPCSRGQQRKAGANPKPNCKARERGVTLPGLVHAAKLCNQNAKHWCGDRQTGLGGLYKYKDLQKTRKIWV